MVAPGSDVDRVIAARRAKFRLLTVEELLGLPPPEWLIRPLIEVGSFGAVYGPSGEAKTFLLLDWALSVASGRDWMGHRVRQGPVVYVIGEGGRNIGKRVRAWMSDRGAERLPDGYFVLEAVSLLTESDVDLFVDRVRALPTPPSLIIFDTLARCFADGDENTARDMNRLVEASGRLQQETGGAVLFAHHPGKKDTEIERGSNSLRAGCDVMFLQRMDSKGVVTLKNTKQKDHEEFPPITLQLKVISLGVDETGEEVTSCVLEPAPVSVVSHDSSAGPATPALLALMTFPGAIANSTDWRKAVQAASSSVIPDRTFQNWRKRLLRSGLVEAVLDRKQVYRVTETGKATFAGAK